MMLTGGGGCARRPVAAYTPPAAPTATAPAARLLFLSGRLTANAAGTRLEVLSLTAVAGEAKAPDADADTPDYLRIAQLDGQGQPLAQVRLVHPLRRSVEHVGDDHRTFQRSEVVLPTAEFFVRLTLLPAATRIRVEEIINGTATLLTELPVPAKS